MAKDKSSKSDKPLTRKDYEEIARQARQFAIKAFKRDWGMSAESVDLYGAAAFKLATWDITDSETFRKMLLSSHD